MFEMNLGWSALLLLGTAVAVTHWRRRKGLIAFYAARRVLYRDWLKIYGNESKGDIQKYLRCFGDSFYVPKHLVHKLGPDDGLMDFYHRDYSSGEADALEANMFIHKLKKDFDYVVSESDGSLTMGELFEKITGLKRKGQP